MYCTIIIIWSGSDYNYSTVQEFYEAEMSSRYSSCEEMLIDQFIVDPEGFDENN